LIQQISTKNADKGHKNKQFFQEWRGKKAGPSTLSEKSYQLHDKYKAPDRQEV
jgi:hypothetical protein